MCNLDASNEEPDLDNISQLESFLRANGFGPASNTRSSWPPIRFQEALKAIHAACKYVVKSFSKHAVLELAAEYVKYNYFSETESTSTLTSTLREPPELLFTATGLAPATHTHVHA